jgi:hypothetical protein
MEIFLGLAALVAILYYGYLRFFVKPDATDLKEPAVVADKPVEPPEPEPVVEAAPEPVAEVAAEPVAVAQTVARVKSSTPRANKKK